MKPSVQTCLLLDVCACESSRDNGKCSVGRVCEHERGYLHSFCQDLHSARARLYSICAITVKHMAPLLHICRFNLAARCSRSRKS